MYGNSTKLGRTGAGGNNHGNKRSSYPPPPSHRPSAPPGGRMSLGNSGSGSRNRANTTNSNNNSGAAAKSGISPVEENFSLVPGRDPPAFAMIIRLTPDLVDEISRVEADGGSAKIRFDSNANNTTGNVIGVGEKDFRFTWSSENSDLCDLYEERQSGVDGNGLLVESGCAWRKVNVQRILDESTTNHVKMRSEEAERKQKSRKAIILDPANPSMKNQMKALAAAETNPWRMPFKQHKKEPTFKKRNFEPTQVSAPPKPAVYKSGSSTSASAVKGRQSASPLPSPPDHSIGPSSSFGIGTFTKSHAIVEEIIQTPPVMNKEKISSYDKEIPSRNVSRTPASKGIEDVGPIDLQSILISLLKESPKGMSLKALEKAIGDTIPNSVKNVEPIVNKIACLQASGRYILKPASELESFKKPSYESGRSSPEDNMHQKDNHDPRLASESAIVEKIFTNDDRDDGQLNKQFEEESMRFEDIGIQHRSPDLLGQKRVSNIIEEHVGSSSNSGSDSSDSDSSDTGSPSRKKSKSSVRSGTGSSSDSESDASSNSKEGSDVDVDIMSSDNEKEQVQNHGLPLQDEMDERQDDHGFSALEVETILPNNQEAEIPFHPEESEKPVEHTQSFTSDPHVYQERQNFIGSLFDEKENLARDGFRQEYSDSSERISKSNKSKRTSDEKFDEKSVRSKRLKAGSLPQPPISGSRDSYSYRPDDDLYKVSHVQMTDRGSVVGTAESDLQSGFDQETREKSVQDFHQRDHKFLDHGGLTKIPDTEVKHGKRIEGSGRRPKHGERSSHMHTSMSMQEDKAYRETQDEDAYNNHKKVPKNFKDSAFSGRRPSHSDTQYRKHDEFVEKFQETEAVSNLYMESLSKDTDLNCVGKAPTVNGRSKVLQRELSELELGELRENVLEATTTVKEFERRGSFKQSASKVRVTDTWNVDMTAGAPAGKETEDPVKQSPPSISAGFTYPESMFKKMTPELYGEDKRRPQHRGTQSQSQHSLRAHQTEVGSHSTKLADASSKRRKGESETGQVIGVQGNKETHKKARLTESQPRDNKRERKSKKENKKQPSITIGGLANGQKESATLPENNNFAQKKRESSSDENSCSYSKYEKDEPELKGPIKDFSQYEEYAQEYRDKYDSYLSLDKVLETDRNHFKNLGKSLELSKGREKDRYYNLVGELKDAYQQCGPRHKRLKNIFVVLHEELKTLKQRIKDYALQYAKD